MIVKKIGKLILIVILLLAFIYSIYWLWQRQPKPAQIKQETTNQVQTPKPQKAGFVQVPKDSQVLSSGKIEISGKVDSETYIVVVSNSISAIGKSEKSGEFKIPIELSRGLNLLDIQILDNSLSPAGSEQKTLFVTEGETLPQNWQVYAGSVKSIL